MSGGLAPPPARPHRTAAAQPAPVPAPMAVRALRLTRFRNYASFSHAFAEGPVVLSGPNGAGKTNLLEALSLLAPGRGLRGARLDDLRCRTAANGGAWAVAAQLETPATGAGGIAVGTGSDPGGGDRRVVRIDGKTVRGQAALADHAAVVWLTPAMDRLFTDAPGHRRQFLDRLAASFEPRHAHELAAYGKAVRARLRLLLDDAEPAWLSAAEETMAAHGAAVAATRGAVVAQLSAALRMADGPFPRAALAVEGELDRWLETMPALDAEQRFAAALQDARARDRDSGITSFGAHRSDLAVWDLDRSMTAAQCSTGEQKALLIAIVLACARLHAARRGAAPLLLLDEVAAHLDPVRRNALLEASLALGSQCWFTGADAAQFEALAGRARFFAVGDGKLRPLAAME